jgi:hypothetical protein
MPYMILFVAVTAKHMATNVKRSPIELLPFKAVSVPDPSDHTRLNRYLHKVSQLKCFDK